LSWLKECDYINIGKYCYCCTCGNADFNERFDDFKAMEFPSNLTEPLSSDVSESYLSSQSLVRLTCPSN